MDGRDGLEMLNLVEQQDDIRVAKVLRTHWSAENDEYYLWSTNECRACGADQVEGDVGFVWGKPLNNERAAKVVSMVILCSEECVERAMEAWADELETDVMTGYFTDF